MHTVAAAATVSSIRHVQNRRLLLLHYVHFAASACARRAFAAGHQSQTYYIQVVTCCVRRKRQAPKPAALTASWRMHSGWRQLTGRQAQGAGRRRCWSTLICCLLSSPCSGTAHRCGLYVPQCAHVAHIAQFSARSRRARQLGQASRSLKQFSFRQSVSHISPMRNAAAHNAMP